ncbi:U6 snRNA-associated Sm-like protein LSm1, putative [Hepatocystis sp. ex Piliocolobus tephrosceles]|nr:U6 snRNA-associated Sm-like protein LSm1, putative [Hepatocystis sp. ex Piliocolobus tephrosceles]
MAQPAMPLWINSFEEDIDTYIFISSRDNKLYLGILRTYDQYGNVFLTHCVEKFILSDLRYFSDVYVGNLIIRGDNIAYFGTIDKDKYTQIFDYSKENINDDNLNVKNDMNNLNTLDNVTSDNIILHYKPIHHILNYMGDNNNDTPILEN